MGPLQARPGRHLPTCPVNESFCHMTANPASVRINDLADARDATDPSGSPVFPATGYPPPRLDVRRIVFPESVAVIGASEDVRKFGGRIFNALTHHRFAGRLYPINPGREQVFGVPAYPAIGAVPEAVDLVLIAVPASQLLETVGDCARAGAGACVVITAKLGEFDEAGAALQADVVDIARRHGMRLVGPNCMGIVNPPHALALSSTATLTSIERLRRGGVAFVSQSGALLGALLVLGHDHGVGFSSLISVGNQADLELCDFLECFIEDEATTTLCVYVEGLKDVPRFRRLARRAWELGKPLLAVKAGRTQVGQQAARSHTASLAGSYTAFAALAEAAGILVLDEPEGMLLTAGFFDKIARLPHAAAASGARGIGLIASSGGGGAILADRLALAGLPLAQWQPATRERLATHFLDRHIHNPMDLGAHKGNPGLAAFTDTIDTIADDPEVAVVVYLFTPQPLMAETAAGLIAAYRRSGKPFLVIIDTASFAPEVRAQLTESGIPVVSRADDALRILRSYGDWLAYRARGWALPEDQANAAAPPPLANLSLPQAGPLTEQEAKALFRAYGIPVNAEHVAATPAAAIAAAGRIGYPVVLKGASRQVVHKSDLGLVHLGLSDAAAVAQAFARIEAAGHAAGLTDLQVVVAAQVGSEAGRDGGGIEVLLGARFDPEYGPQVLVGLGGVLVEVVQDVASAPAPLDVAGALALLRKLRLFPLLQGYRSRPRADLEALAAAVAALSRLAHDLGPRLVELDINPLIVLPAGQGVVAVDGRATLAASVAATVLSPFEKALSHE